ncbi:hypothetical protein MTBBW1_520009 [Desulfamplus magnetovallimortis]|uniref:Uncharacterized protein n=1 Tax=Desulfamplus magnetovallimortis TaxID=1246637 RepID=A0A1W1HHX3_9BACT|nr:hypothetical protein MTBBW1_520009 [Desulfamplus magnetovallimortis]
MSKLKKQGSVNCRDKACLVSTLQITLKLSVDSTLHGNFDKKIPCQP